MDLHLRRARAILRSASAVAIVALLASCSDSSTVTSSPDATGELPLKTRADSAAWEAKLTARGINPRLNVTTTSLPIPLYRRDRVNITIMDTECSRQGNIVQVVGTLSGTLTTDACFDHGAQLALGPAQQAGAIRFTGTGKFDVSGTYPRFTVKMEDATDNDFNDVVMVVEIIPGDCDPMLNDPVIRAELDRIMQQTGWNLPFSQRKEHGGFFVEDREGNRRFEEFNYTSQGLCHILRTNAQEVALRAAGNEILGVLHTHPSSGGSFPNPGNCLRWNAASQTLVPDQQNPLLVSTGPSTWDLGPWQGSNDPGYAGFVIEANGTVHRWEKGPDGQLRRIRFNINAQCLP